MKKTIALLTAALVSATSMLSFSASAENNASPIIGDVSCVLSDENNIMIFATGQEYLTRNRRDFKVFYEIYAENSDNAEDIVKLADGMALTKCEDESDEYDLYCVELSDEEAMKELLAKAKTLLDGKQIKEAYSQMTFDYSCITDHDGEYLVVCDVPHSPITLVTYASKLAGEIVSDDDAEKTYANPQPYVNEDYATSSESFDMNFKELLEMNDEEFMALDKYKGNQSADTMSWHTGYNTICKVLNTEYADIASLAELMEISTKELLKNIVENKEVAVNGKGEFRTVIPFYADASYSTESVMDSKCVAIGNLTNTYCINGTTDFRNNTDENAELNQKIDDVWLAKQLNESFGDEIQFKCYEEVDVETKETTGRIKIEFDMDDKLSLSKENVMYSAKILTCLAKINNGVSPEYNYAYSGTEKAEIFDSTVKVGDANGDSELNVRDCAEIAGKLSKSDNTLSKWVDYNLDQKVNVRDAAAIASFLAKKK